MEAKVENERLLLFPRLSVNNWLLKIDVLRLFSLFSADSIDIDSLAFAKA